MSLFSSFQSFFKASSNSSINTNNGVLSMLSARWLLISSLGCLMVLSLLMVASASIPFTYNYSTMAELHFFNRQALFMGIGLVAAFIIMQIPFKWIYDKFIPFLLLLASLFLLIFTLFFGVEINGAKRWIDLGVFNFQPAEFAKLACIMFTADFVVRRSSEVRSSWDGFIRLFIIILLIVGALLLQPDFGTLVIIGGCILAIFWVAGAPIGQFVAMTAMLVGAAVVAITQADYRLTRVLSFRDAFDDVQGTDYQLSRSLIAFGRGEFTGVGYGESVQKLSHLPEAHTDFLLAITGEELGFIGVSLVLLFEALIIASIMRISYVALKRKQMRFSYTAFGIAIMFIGQTMINAGMNMGLLPTKGLTMPFFSYGGSSMLICLMMIGFVLRIDKESARIPVSQCRNY